MNRYSLWLMVALAATGCGDDDKKPAAARAEDAGGVGVTRIDASIPFTPRPADRDAETALLPPDASAAVAVQRVGEACDASAQCGGASAECLRAVPALGASFEDGYCSASCSANSMCGAAGGCPVGEALKSPIVALALANMPGLSSAGGNCLLRCQRASDDCRDGYRCSSLSEMVPQLRALPAVFLPPSLAEPYCLPDLVVAPGADAGRMDVDAGDGVRTSGDTDASPSRGAADAGQSDAAL